MKLHLLELTGFGPFRETQRVDFDAFDADGVFLIAGRTGAGKSSILDGVCFALYGTVPRYDGGERRLRSDHCHLTDPTSVRLEFTAGEARWRVTRAPDYDRPAKRGGGLTTEPARAELEELVDGVWVGRAARPRDVGIALDDLLGIGAQQFQQVILLAQNRFSRFLLASGEERQSLLRTLFGTRRFDRYREDLDERRREAQKRLDAATERARTLLDLAERLVDEQLLDGDDAAAERGTGMVERREALVAAVQRADYRAEQAATARAHADDAAAAAAHRHADLTERAARSRERAAARARLAELDEQQPRIARQRSRLTRARAAESLRAPLDAADRAVAAHTAAQDAAQVALADWTGAGGDATVDVAQRIEQVTAELARWADAAREEQTLLALHDRLRELGREIGETDDLLAAVDAQLAQLPAQRAALDDAMSTARSDAARCDDLRRRVAELTAQADAAREAAVLGHEVEVADRAHLLASAAASESAATVTSLLQRRLAGFAGELSAALRDGEACAVCGSTDHPRPAEPATDPVTDDVLAAAESARDAAAAQAASAAAVARDARERLAAAHGRAGGHDEKTAAATLAAVRVEADAADAARSQLERIQAQSAELDALETAAASERAALAERRAALREEHAASTAHAARAESIVDAARGSFGTVAERIVSGEAERARASTLADARAALSERARALDHARADAAARLSASEFAGADEARAALLDPDETARIDDELSTHAAELAAARARLLDLELDTVGDEIGAEELASSAKAAASADAARSSAIAAQRDAENAASRLRDLAQSADAAYGEVSAVTEDAASVTRLADTVAGRAPNTMKMDLETFVLAAELEEIVAAANVRLSEMSSGRYTLHHSDARAARGRASGLGIEVLDAYTGRLRGPQSLSGGETFLASLALALGLGEVVTARAGGIRLDTLFVDEGFGSLDPETLELAMRTLDELRAGGRTVGVISHVEAMKEQLPAQLVVETTPQGPSVIRQDAALPA